MISVFLGRDGLYIKKKMDDCRSGASVSHRDSGFIEPCWTERLELMGKLPKSERRAFFCLDYFDEFKLGMTFPKNNDFILEIDIPQKAGNLL